jgi:hypothetical protein
MIYNPKKDGVSHINIYSKGKTELGRWMSNFAKIDILTVDGAFKSIEGYWFWLGSHNDNLRKLWGWEAKSFGESQEQVYTLSPVEFREKIKAAIIVKVNADSLKNKELTDSTLPFTHYYVYGTEDEPIVRDAGFKWLVEFWEDLRKDRQ